MEIIHRIPESELIRATRAYARSDFETLEALKRPTATQFDATLVPKLIDRARESYAKPSDSDGWLAGRIHAVLRIPRRAAADRGMWFWLATNAFRKYLEWRHPRTWDPAKGEKEPPWWRYNGDLLRNGVSRLWWGAEMLRNGPDYSLVEAGFRSVRTYMFVSELRYSRYREAARAFARAAAGEGTGTPLNDAEVQELSILFNTYLRLDVLESHGDGAPACDREWDSAWAERVPTWLELTSEDPKALVGPDGGYSNQSREAAILKWLRELVPEARHRAVEKKEAKAAAAVAEQPAGAA
jgi:hypothetical protein